MNFGPSLLRNIPETSFQFKDFLKEKTINSFLLKNTNKKEITKFILQLNNKNGLGPISISILKENVKVFYQALFLIALIYPA